jgi:molecular chaperone DnaK (HSP70)
MDDDGAVAVAPIPQLVNANEVAAQPLLPSFLYMPAEREFPADATALPWDADAKNGPGIVGRFAQRRGAEVSGRLVSSAKSWLSYSAVDRAGALLPWKAAEGVARISPVDASAAYLRHLRMAWEHENPGAPFADQEVLVTIPASFDAVSRELTEKAAQAAGFGNVTLLEEPQAAFYAWIARHDDWRQRVGKGDLVLVVDIGGGTTDFTLIAVSEHEGQLQLDRVAVGDHILLGGDNIDLALAHTVAAELAGRGTKIDSFQLQALWNNCRLAKEKLLDPASPAKEVPVTILGKGSSLIGGTIKATLRRQQVEQVLAAFLPEVAVTDFPQKPRTAGLQEMGLPYASDAAITRHLARFLHQGDASFARPTHVLFNGGVLHAPFVRERLLSVLNGWLRDAGAPEVQVLSGEDLMHAVARGAAYYGAARHGKGVRIRGGIARSYYVGIESAMPAVPGIPAPVKAFSVAQFGMEEGTSAKMAEREFGLAVGDTAEFRFFSSTTRKQDAPGTLIEDFGEELEELSPVAVRLDSADPAGALVPVSLETVITETGMLQLWCVARDGRRWKLEFNVREK